MSFLWRQLFVTIFYAVAEFQTLSKLIEKELNMTILPEFEAQILRYYHAEKWRIGHRSIFAVYPRNLGEISDFDRQSLVRDG